MPIQRNFISQFARLPDHDQFYLAGGTALAEFYLGHRLSFDLDIFTPEPGLILPMSYQVEGVTQAEDLTISVVRRFATYVEFAVSDGVETLKVDLAHDSPFRLAPLEASRVGIRVSDLADLRVDKLLAYYGRAEPRDAVDLHFIFKDFPVNELLELAAQKDPGFDLYWFAVALGHAASFPDEVERWPVRMLLPFDPRELKADFARLALEIMSGLTGASNR